MAHTYIDCACCGARVDLERYRRRSVSTAAIMWKYKVCFECAYWKNIVENREPDMVVVGKALYRLTEPLTQPDLQHASHKRGATFLFDLRNQQAYMTVELMPLGRIPESFLKALPPQYVFLTYAEYKSIWQFEGAACFRKGCFDRHHCLWYHKAVCEPEEPWNIVPDDYEVGNECCPCFINKTKLYELR